MTLNNRKIESIINSVCDRFNVHCKLYHKHEQLVVTLGSVHASRSAIPFVCDRITSPIFLLHKRRVVVHADCGRHSAEDTFGRNHILSSSGCLSRPSIPYHTIPRLIDWLVGWLDVRLVGSLVG